MAKQGVPVTFVRFVRLAVPFAGLQLALAYLDHLAVLGQAERVKGTDPVAWRAI